MDYILAGTVILSGITIVFLVLILLTFIVALFGKLMSGKANTNKSSGVVAQAPVQTAPKAVAQGAPMQATQDDISEEVVAVISAAVAASLGGSENFVIKSVKRIKETASARSAWSIAGMQNNTAPF